VALDVLATTYNHANPVAIPSHSMHPTTVIARLVFAGPEDAHTELLAELLRVPDLQRAFCERVLGLPDRLDQPLNVATQVGNRSAAGFPDLSIEGPGLHILVESKLGAGLTPNQPGEYMRELAIRRANSGGRALLALLVPVSRMEHMRVQLRNRLGLPELTGAVAEHHGVGLRLISWAEVAEALRDVQVADPVIAYLRDSFVDLVPRIISYAPVPLTREHIAIVNTQNFALAHVAIADMLDAVRKALKERGEIVAESKGKDLAWGGFTTRPADNPGLTIWIGYHYRLAVRLPDSSPLWMQFGGAAFGTNAQARMRQSDFPLIEAQAYIPEGWGGLMTPLRLSLSEDQDAHVRQVIEMVDRARQFADA
jgi:hypothetical protein